jgi:hypothetical protein
LLARLHDASHDLSVDPMELDALTLAAVGFFD